VQRDNRRGRPLRHVMPGVARKSVTASETGAALLDRDAAYHRRKDGASNSETRSETRPLSEPVSGELPAERY
jgi:hypothetical protein